MSITIKKSRKEKPSVSDGVNIIYIRNESRSTDKNGIPHRGTPNGAIAYKQVGARIEFAFALCNTAHDDKWNGELARHIVAQRLTEKRGVLDVSNPDLGRDANDCRYFQFDLPTEDAKRDLKPFEVVAAILSAVEDKRLPVLRRFSERLSSFYRIAVARNTLIMQSKVKEEAPPTVKTA